MLRSGLSPSGARAIGDMYEHPDVRPLLATIRVPTLVLYRSGDEVVLPSWSRAVARGIPGAREIELDGIDHLFCAGDQQALVDEVEKFLTGRLSTRASDRVLATVMFTDIVGSTQHATQSAISGGARSLTAATESRIGRLAVTGPRRKHHWRRRSRRLRRTGPRRAGIALRAAAPSELGVQLRVGVHTGECEVIGEDLGGVGVHTAARVQATAAPWEVLVSSTVKDLVVGSGLRFADRGEHSLKGLSEPWRLHAAVADDSQ